MKINFVNDSHYVIGSSHLVCQDYAQSGSNPFPYVLLSDGCSASKNSDIGARCLVATAERNIIESKPNWFEPSNLIVQTLAANLNWEMENFDATLLSLIVENNNYYFDCHGDGVLIKKLEGNKYELIEIEFPSNAPFYASYYLNSSRSEEYLNCFGGIKKIIKYAVDLDQKSYTKNVEVAEFLSKNERKVFSPNSWMNLCWYHESMIIEDKIQYLAIASDGIMSMVKKNNEQTLDFLLLEAIPMLLNFKSFSGNFVKRRLKFYTNIDSRNAEISHTDDLSLGVIVIK